MESTEFIKRFSLKGLFSHKPLVKHIPKLLSLGSGVLLICWLIAQLDFSSARLILQDISILPIVIGFFFYLISFYLRAKRFSILLAFEGGLKSIFPIVLVHYTALNIIPARLGELSYVYLLKKFHQIPPGSSVSTLLSARVFDQIAISTLFLLSLGIVDMRTPWLRTVSWIVGSSLLISVVCLLLVLAYKHLCLRLLKKLIFRLKWENSPIIQRIMTLLEEILTGFDEIKSRRKTVLVFSLSLLIWLSILSVNYFVWKAFQIPLSYFEVVLSSTFLILLTVIPFQVFSGLGIRSITWTVVAGAMGVGKNAAIVSALGSRIISTLFLFILGAYGLWKISQRYTVT